jgi:hypothetical protein
MEYGLDIQYSQSAYPRSTEHRNTPGPRELKPSSMLGIPLDCSSAGHILCMADVIISERVILTSPFRDSR